MSAYILQTCYINVYVYVKKHIYKCINMYMYIYIYMLEANAHMHAQTTHKSSTHIAADEVSNGQTLSGEFAAVGPACSSAATTSSPPLQTTA